MVHELIGEAWLIFDQESNAIFPGNLLCRHDGEFVPRNPVAESDSENFSTCSQTSHGDSVDHFRKGQVVHIARAAGDLFAAFLARNRLSNLAVFHGYLCALRAQQRSIWGWKTSAPAPVDPLPRL